MSNDGIPMSDEDIYGQRHPIESVDLIAAKLAELEEELSQLSDEDAQGWTQAKAKCAPDLVNDDFKLMFLRCEVFNADVSVFLRGARFSLFYCNECDEAPPLTLTNLLHHIFAIHSSPQNVLESIGIKESLCLAKTRPFFP